MTSSGPRPLSRRALSDPVPPVAHDAPQLSPDQPLQSSRGGQPNLAVRAFTQVGADLFGMLPRLFPVQAGRKRCSTVDTPHPFIMSDTAALAAPRASRHVRGRGTGGG